MTGKSFQVIGHVLLAKMALSTELAASLMKEMPYVKTVGEIKGVKGEFRQPQIKKVLGNGFITIHKEHGILYKLNARKIMFSKGNLLERKRLRNKIRENEVIVDMFAGIGYFALGIAKSNPNAKIYALEKNKTAFRYLKENIALNKTSNIIPLNKDCRYAKLPPADRVIMGYFPNTEKYLPKAVELLKKGGHIHFHNAYNKSELWERPKKLFACFNLKPTSKRVVKSLSPSKCHVVVDGIKL